MRPVCWPSPTSTAAWSAARRSTRPIFRRLPKQPKRSPRNWAKPPPLPMTTFLSIVHVCVCIFLILVVLLQQGRGGGLGGAFGGTTQQVFGGRGAGNFMTRLTWGCAMVFILTSVSLAYIASSGDRSLKARQGQSSGQKP